MDYMKIIEEKEAEIKALQKENEELNETVEWMHDTIWKLLKKDQNTTR